MNSPMIHPLDNPTWSTLSSFHSELAIVATGARRFRADVSPISAVSDPFDMGCWQGLADITRADEWVDIFLPPGHVPPTSLWTVEERFELSQMVCTADSFRAVHSVAAPNELRRLVELDGSAMVALARLTDPGPMEVCTVLTGMYLGLFDQGALIAMAGERMRFKGFTEVSGVCTHGDYRRRGLAAMLASEITRMILARGDAAFLHLTIDNHAAKSLYEKLGFSTRRRLDVIRASKNSGV